MQPPRIINPPPFHKREKRFTQGFLIKIIGIGIILMACVAGMLWWTIQQSQSPRGFISNLQTQVEFPLFYPAQLPEGLALNHKQYSVTKQVVMTSYIYDRDKRLIVSMQPSDKVFDSTTLQPTSEFTASIGRAYIADAPNRMTAAVVGEKSWVLINAPSGIAVDQLTKFINGLRPLN